MVLRSLEIFSLSASRKHYVENLEALLKRAKISEGLLSRRQQSLGWNQSLTNLAAISRQLKGFFSLARKGVLSADISSFHQNRSSGLQRSLQCWGYGWSGALERKKSVYLPQLTAGTHCDLRDA